MCVGSNMKVATHTTKATSPRSKLSYKRLFVLKLLVHYKKEEIKEFKIQTGIGTLILLKSKARNVAYLGHLTYSSGEH